MSLKDTFKQMRELLANITQDLEKSENGNKAASQRVRTGTVKLEKLAKLFRKESIASEKKNKGQKRPAKSAAGAASAKGKSSPAAGASKAKSAAAKSAGAAKSKAGAASKAKSSSAVKAKPKAKSAKASTSFRARQMSVKRATAKLPTRRVGR